jgi:hypothetical protein
VIVIRGPNVVRGSSGNSVVIASQSPLDPESLRERLRSDTAVGEASGDVENTVGEVLSGDALDAYLDGATILTDDFAPVDQLIN